MADNLVGGECLEKVHSLSIKMKNIIYVAYLFYFHSLMALYFIIRNRKYYFFPTPQKSCFSYLHKKYLINQHCCIIFARLILVRKYGDYWLDCLCVNLLFLFLGWEKCVNLQELSVLRPWQSWWDLDLIS